MSSEKTLNLVSRGRSQIEHVSSVRRPYISYGGSPTTFDRTSNFVFGLALGMFVTLHLWQLYNDNVVSGRMARSSHQAQSLRISPPAAAAKRSSLNL